MKLNHIKYLSEVLLRVSARYDDLLSILNEKIRKNTVTRKVLTIIQNNIRFIKTIQKSSLDDATFKYILGLHYDSVKKKN